MQKFMSSGCVYGFLQLRSLLILQDIRPMENIMQHIPGNLSFLTKISSLPQKRVVRQSGLRMHPLGLDPTTAVRPWSHLIKHVGQVVMFCNMLLHHPPPDSSAESLSWQCM
ncbi:hypothetical protein SCP_1202260 [Sparassis crispa]|uniref:Uncharacterized protein n=1 Tax=Sparassis crispa TaxID=139825 RepID=A0A401H0T3_9APHY|nr:hypothetical protein SCP_1202260 [Sparassis crispa]GBE88000.1 hypothetical protein SCP_1202260 [Sparassis crispa]